MEARFISNVDPDDADSVLRGLDLETSLFILVSKSGTTQETLANETLVRNRLEAAGLDSSKHMVAVTSTTSPLAQNPAISPASSSTTSSAAATPPRARSAASSSRWPSDPGPSPNSWRAPTRWTRQPSSLRSAGTPSSWTP